MPIYAHIKTDRVDGWFRVLDKNVIFNDETNEDVKAEDHAFMYDLEDWQTTALIQRLASSRDLLTSMLRQNPTPAETLMKQGVLYVNKIGGYYPDPTNEIIAIKEHPQRPLKDDEGFTDWLDSAGHFYECIYGTHKNVAFNRDITDDEAAIYLTCAVSPITNKHVDCANIGLKEPTDAQRRWLKTYKHQLSPAQRKELAAYL
jgi:hypothetical protein